jgi:hypothetical protein
MARYSESLAPDVAAPVRPNTSLPVTANLAREIFFGPNLGEGLPAQTRSCSGRILEAPTSDSTPCVDSACFAGKMILSTNVGTCRQRYSPYYCEDIPRSLSLVENEACCLSTLQKLASPSTDERSQCTGALPSHSRLGAAMVAAYVRNFGLLPTN